MAKIKTCKHIFKRLSLALVGLATICVAVGYAINTINKNIHDANAEGATFTANVTVNIDGEDEDDEDYPYRYYNDEWLTHFFIIDVPGVDSNFTAFCAQPEIIDYPEGNTTSQLLPDTETNRMVKLLVYLATAHTQATESLIYGWYSWLDDYGYLNNDGLYVYEHATIGYIFNNGDVTGLEDVDIEHIEAIKQQLQQMINENHNYWLMAQDYSLYGTVGDEDTQVVVWVGEEVPIPGSITVHKCDAELEGASCDLSATRHFAQGGGSLEGITFTIYNDSGNRVYNPFDGNFYNDGQAMGTATTNANGIATFANLPTGVDYNIAESTPNTGYLPTNAQAWVEDLTISGATVSFSNNIIRGDVTFKKVDENGNPMANVAFTIASNTTGEQHRVVTDSNGVVDTGNSYIPHTTGTNGYDSITGGSYIHQNYGAWFNGVDPDSGLQGAAVDNEAGALPYDSYTLIELECDANQYCDFASTSTPFSIANEHEVLELENIVNDCAEFGISTSATDTTDGDKFVEASTTASITDTITYCAKAGLTYTIQGSLMYTDGTPVTIAGVPVQQEITDTPANDCGNTAAMTFELDTSELAGKSIVVFEKLLYNGEVVVDHSNPNDTDQTVTIISLDTYALDKSDSDKEVLATEDATITDHIKYCLVAGTEYTIMGTLMNKTTGEAITINNGPIWNTTSLTPEENCGDLYLDFEFDATGLGGTEVVVFESAGITSPTQLSDNDMCLEYDTDIIGEDGSPTCASYFHSVISHADIDDVAQTVLVSEPDAPKAADTGRLTSATDSSKNGTSGILLGGVSVLVVATGYFGIRLFSRKRFLGKAK